MTVGLVLAGFIYGAFIKPALKNTDIRTYEMVVKGNPVSNIEIYAFGSEINSMKSDDLNSNEEGIQLAKSLDISDVSIEPIQKEEDMVNHYFEQIEMNTLRGIETDTLFFQDFKLKDHKSKMENSDFSMQRIKITIKNAQINPNEVQEKLLNYFNNLPSVKNNQEAQLSILQNYERELKRSLVNIDSIMYSRSVANKKSVSSNGEQLMVNTASRGNVEWDLLRFTEYFTKRLYGTQKLISSYQNGVNVVSNLRSVKEESLLGNSGTKYGILGFLLACLIILGLRFDKYLDKYKDEKI
ncbi:MAG: hypothetical protein H3C39_09875 [Flavobacteriia bacterium]|nr:hypothetical protein [Flavobacteriia bacterium]